VLLNRRVLAVVLCRACGQALRARNCAVFMDPSQARAQMEMPLLRGTSRKIPTSARSVAAVCLLVGTGSEKLEELLHGIFPQARIGRLDRDTVRGAKISNARSTR